MKAFVLFLICLISFSEFTFALTEKGVSDEEFKRITKILACQYAATEEQAIGRPEIDSDILNICMKSSATVKRIGFCKRLALRDELHIFANRMRYIPETMEDVFGACIQSNASFQVLETCKQATTPTDGFPDIYIDEFLLCIK